MRDEILAYAANQLHTEPEHPWASYPEYIVLRHKDNSKWYAVLMDVEARCLHLSGADRVDIPNAKVSVFTLSGADRVGILNVKLPPLMVDGLRNESGFHAAYHMNKQHWLTIRLDGSVPLPQVLDLLQVSFELTAAKAKKQGVLSRCHDWLIPANPRVYDVEAAFLANEVIRWKQGADIHVGDTVYLYEAAPWSCLRFHCKVEEINIPSEKDKNKKLMKIRLLETYPADYMPLMRLREEFGVYSVRGPRSTPPALLEELRARDREGEKSI